ncbi:MAG: GNAT family N-acetyltransferase [Chloroflexota bacterium]
MKAIRSSRLDLVSLSPEVLAAFASGDLVAAQTLVDFAVPDDFYLRRGWLELVRMRYDQVRKDPAWLPWSLRAIVIREPARVMVGHANFHGPPGINDLMTPDAAEFGYTVFPEHRGKGYATEVARSMMEWARVEHGVTRFISGVEPDNAASLRVNDKVGFTRTGDVVDGELIFELRLP